MLRSTALTAGIALVALFALAAPAATAHPEQDPDETPPIEAKTDNIEFVAHHGYPEGSDQYFQRRAGRQLLNGQQIDAVRDYAFAGGDGSSSPDDGAMHIFDVTDPTDPVHLADIQCQGYHAEVVVYENLMVQGIDSDNQTGCSDDAAARYDPNGEDQPETEGLRIYDVTDPANPVVVAFIGPDQLGDGGVHNLTVIPWAGLLYLASSDFTTLSPRFGFVDLTDPEFPVTMMDVKEITPHATAACHDIGLDPDRELAFCAAVEQTFVWDISDPRQPQHISTIVNPLISIHHGARLAPDGTTLVLNDELAGAAAAFGCLGTGQLGLVGALWFYDLTDPASPQVQGSFSTEELSPLKAPCTSHFYNFIPGTTLLVVGWYESGMIVVDYADPSAPQQHALLLPEGGNFWSAYYWHGYLYGNSRATRADGDAGGLWIARLDGVGDVAPAPQDEGTSWGRWTSALPAPAPESPAPAPSPSPAPPPEPAPAALPATGGSVALLAVAALAVTAAARRRRRT